MTEFIFYGIESNKYGMGYYNMDDCSPLFFFVNREQPPVTSFGKCFDKIINVTKELNRLLSKKYILFRFFLSLNRIWIIISLEKLICDLTLFYEVSACLNSHPTVRLSVCMFVCLYFIVSFDFEILWIYLSLALNFKSRIIFVNNIISLILKFYVLLFLFYFIV